MYDVVNFVLGFTGLYGVVVNNGNIQVTSSLIDQSGPITGAPVTWQLVSDTDVAGVTVYQAP